MNNNDATSASTKCDIRVYNTTSGRQIIGEFGELYDDVLCINNPLEIIRLRVNDDIVIRLIAVVPHNNGQVMYLYSHSLESESFASAALTQMYCKTLLINQLSLLLTESNGDKIKGDGKTITDLDPQDSFKYDWNKSNNRWNN